MPTRPRDGFSSTLFPGDRKRNTTPAARQAKAELREMALAAIGADKAHVLDLFAGDGEMYRAVWHKAAEYVGCDKVWYRDSRTAFVCDNRRALRAIPEVRLKEFNIFDLDAHGSPWEQAAILAQRRQLDPGERAAMLLTEGSGLALNMGHIPTGLQFLTRVKEGAVGGAGAHDELVDMAISTTCRFMRASVEKRWQAKGRKGSALRYITLVLKGIGG